MLTTKKKYTRHLLSSFIWFWFSVPVVEIPTKNEHLNKSIVNKSRCISNALLHLLKPLNPYPKLILSLKSFAGNFLEKLQFNTKTWHIHRHPFRSTRLHFTQRPLNLQPSWLLPKHVGFHQRHEFGDARNATASHQLQYGRRGNGL